MTKAVERGENWFGYYWSPTSLIGRHGMVKLDFGVPYIGDEHWNSCIVKPEQDCADPQPSAWTESEVHTVATDKFKQSTTAEVWAYLGSRVFPGELMNALLAYMDANQVDGADAAAKFVEENSRCLGRLGFQQCERNDDVETSIVPRFSFLKSFLKARLSNSGGLFVYKQRQLWKVY